MYIKVFLAISNRFLNLVADCLDLYTIKFQNIRKILLFTKSHIEFANKQA